MINFSPPRVSLTAMTSDRFVILHHLATAGEHWDLMLEQDQALATWQLLSEFSGRQSCPVLANRINDHRKSYLDYEGPISGGRGVVTRYDSGTYERLIADDSVWIVRICGTRIKGQFSLTRQAVPESSRWILEDG